MSPSVIALCRKEMCFSLGALVLFWEMRVDTWNNIRHHTAPWCFWRPLSQAERNQSLQLWAPIPTCNYVKPRCNMKAKAEGVCLPFSDNKCSSLQMLLQWFRHLESQVLSRAWRASTTSGQKLSQAILRWKGYSRNSTLLACWCIHMYFVGLIHTYGWWDDIANLSKLCWNNSLISWFQAQGSFQPCFNSTLATPNKEESEWYIQAIQIFLRITMRNVIR